jgi:phosphoglycerate dehydrogenase-like enzyme
VLLVGLAPDEVDSNTHERIHALASDLRVIVTRDREAIEALLPEIEIAAGYFPSEFVARAPRLRWYQQWGAGADWLMRNTEAANKDFILTSASGVHTIPISEHIITMLLMLARGMQRAVRAQVRHEWWRADVSQLFELAGKTMLLVGVGAIGARTALLAQALGMRVEGVRNDPGQPAEGVAAMYGPQQLAERLPHADVLVLTVPLSPATRNLIGEPELRAMKPTAVLINIGRGGTIDEPALVAALAEGRLAGAGLDVFAQEPLPQTSPLWDMQNVIITGHYAGINPLYNERAMAIFLDNLQRYRDGAPLRNLVDKAAGY